ncbi:MAG: DUF4349 domain-containing protein [Cyclonatronaceae bacterium]
MNLFLSRQHTPPVTSRYFGNLLFIVALLLFYGGGCGGGNGSDSEPVSSEMASEMASFDSSPQQAMRSSTGNTAVNNEQAREQTNGQQRKLITDGQVSFEVRDLGETRRKVAEAVEKYEAYISSDEEYNADGRRSINMQIRVPARHFDTLLAEVTSDILQLESKQINVRDVTEEFVDVQARLRSKKELEARYAELLEQARAVSDMLEIERQMEQLRGQIESIEGRLQYLQNQVALSTLRLNFYELRPSDMQFGREFLDGLGSGWNNLISFFLFMLRLWPFVVILAGLVWATLRWRKKRKKKT